MSTEQSLKWHICTTDDNQYLVFAVNATHARAIIQEREGLKSIDDVFHEYVCEPEHGSYKLAKDPDVYRSAGADAPEFPLGHPRRRNEI